MNTALRSVALVTADRPLTQRDRMGGAGRGGGVGGGGGVLATMVVAGVLAEVSDAVDRRLLSYQQKLSKVNV